MGWRGEKLAARQSGNVILSEAKDPPRKHRVKLRRKKRKRMSSTYNPAGGTFTGLEAGMVLRDRYEIVALRGQGAFGAVYKAVDRGLDEPRTVAVKLIHPMVAADAIALKNVKREVAIARSLGHPSIVRVWDLVQWRDFTFIVMDYIDGPNLTDLRAEQEGYRFSPEAALKYLGDIASGLDYLHGQDPTVIHRDLKPSNVLIEKRTDRVIITDFGLAREIKDTMSRVSGAATSGSPPYMAPEIWDNESPTVRIDVYALGVMAYEMFSGELPFKGPDYGYQHRSIEAKPVGGLSDALNRTILKALTKNPEGRCASAGEFVAAIKAVLEDEALHACPVCGEAKDIERFTCPRCSREDICSDHRCDDGHCSGCAEDVQEEKRIKEEEHRRAEEERKRKEAAEAEKKRAAEEKKTQEEAARRPGTEIKPTGKKTRTGLYAVVAALAVVVAAGIYVSSSMRFTDNADGSVTDTKTGLMWAVKDNVKDIDWTGAKRYCEGLTLAGHSDWRLPTSDELEGLYNAEVTTYQVKDKGIIRLTACCPWASETKETVSGSRAAIFNFGNGRRRWVPQSGSIGNRALPVRSGK